MLPVTGSNPIHYAIALHYGREEGSAVLVLSKEKDLKAGWIRETAEHHSIPIVKDEPLERSTDNRVEVDRAITP